MKTVILSFLLFFVSCKKQVNDSDLKDNIYFEILKYQKENADKIEKFLNWNKAYKWN